MTQWLREHLAASAVIARVNVLHMSHRGGWLLLATTYRPIDPSIPSQAWNATRVVPIANRCRGLPLLELMSRSSWQNRESGLTEGRTVLRIGGSTLNGRHLLNVCLLENEGECFYMFNLISNLCQITWRIPYEANPLVCRLEKLNLLNQSNMYLDSQKS